MFPQASLRRICRILDVSRSTLYPAFSAAGTPRLRREDPLTARLRELAKQHPTFGYRRLWALLRFGDGHRVTPNRVHRLVKRHRLQVKMRQATPRPRVQAREAERALESACLARFGTLRPSGPTPMLRSDNGLIFTSRRFREACRFYRLSQEFITPYTPQQNGLVERFFRSLKEECVWQFNFESFEQARKEIHRWIGWYNLERPHQALGYQSPQQFRAASRQPRQPDRQLCQNSLSLV